MSVIATLEGSQVVRTAVLRTARKLFDGLVFAE
jgi:2-methylaconitate cis-trans-isomerase PrpF